MTQHKKLRTCGYQRVTDEALSAENAWFGPSSLL